MTKSQLADLIQRSSPLDRKQSYDLAKVLHAALCGPEPKMKREELNGLTAAFIAQGGKVTTARKTFDGLKDNEALAASTRAIVRDMRLR